MEDFTSKPVISNLYMEFFETKILPQICNFQLKWFRYVDDIIVLWPLDRDVLHFLNNLNSLVPSIKFKIEQEVEHSLPFLDTVIININNGLKFKIYRKPTHVDAYIHYFSNHHINVKRSTFSGMFLRAFRICDPEYLEEEIKYIYTIARNLCYPESFVDYCLTKAKRSYYGVNADSLLQPKNILVLPFHQEFTLAKYFSTHMK